MITKQQYEENQRILEGAPKDGKATHVADDGGYWVLTANQNIKDELYIDGKGYRALSTWGFSFRALADIKNLNAQYEQLLVLKSALCAVLGWRELSSHGEFPVERIEEICRDAINKTPQEGE